MADSVGLVIAQLNSCIRAQLSIKELETETLVGNRNEHSNGFLAMRFNQDYYDQLTKAIEILQNYMIEYQGVEQTSKEDRFKELAIEYNKKLGKIHQTATVALKGRARKSLVNSSHFHSALECIKELSNQDEIE